LPLPLKKRIDVLAAVRERFEKEFARHTARRPSAPGDLPPSS